MALVESSLVSLPDFSMKLNIEYNQLDRETKRTKISIGLWDQKLSWETKEGMNA